jgi:hypothetical protein
MTTTEADELAKRIINTWRGGPPLTEWRDELLPLDAGQAGTAFARLKRTLENAPSIARFLAEYRSLQMHDASNPDDKCPECSNSGWVACFRQYENKGEVYSGARPCAECGHGRVAAQSQTWQRAPHREPVSDARLAELTKRKDVA